MNELFFPSKNLNGEPVRGEALYQALREMQCPGDNIVAKCCARLRDWKRRNI